MKPRNIPREEAKKEIWDLIVARSESGLKFYPSDIAIELKLDYDLVIEIVQELIEEDKVETDEDHAQDP